MRRLLLLGLLCLAGCSTSDVGSSATLTACTTGADCASDELCVAQVCTPIDEVDASGADTTADVDTTPDVTPDTTPFEPTPCTSAADCESGYCVPTRDGNLCTVACNGPCPIEGWICRLVQSSGSDVAQICMPPDNALCSPCNADVDCDGLANLCLENLDGTFCGIDCSTSNTCPDGFRCQDVTRFNVRNEPVNFRQCTPETNTCSGCYDQDNDGYGIGARCAGSDCDDLNPGAYEGRIELCNGTDDDCDGNADEDFDLNTDPLHCGDCGISCNAVRGTGGCAEGLCIVTACETGYFDANADFLDGCEYACTPNADTGGIEACNGIDDDCDAQVDEDFDLQRDNSNCGVCGQSCTVNNGAAHCEFGGCVLDGCEGSFRDCNLLPLDGCESDPQTDPDHCGSCARACELEGAIQACVAGDCAVGGCQTGRADCDTVPFNGCEIDLLNDPLHCGACDIDCSFADGTPDCNVGACGVATCNGTLADCNGLYSDLCEIDTAADKGNCGGCGRVCDETNTDAVSCGFLGCQVDLCSAGWGNCDGLVGNGCEQDTLESMDHCGGCGLVCDPPGAAGYCTGGTCRFDTCLDGFRDIDGDPSNGCEYGCVPLSDTDEPDDTGLDANCDGIDGDAARAVFLSASGSDRNSGLNPGDPVRSLAKALDVANTTAGRNQVLVTLGSFTGSGLTVSTPVSIYGGYSLTFAGRGATRSVFTSTSAVALTYSGIGDRTTLDRMTIQSANQTAPGAESVAVAVANAGAFLTIRNALLRAGTGGSGTNGAPGVSGASGDSGVTGGAGCDGNCSGRTGATAGAAPGGGGGGTGRYRNSGIGGAGGSQNGSACGGYGGGGSGGGGLGCSDGNPNGGSQGGNGCDAPSGGNGTPANGTGSFAGIDWVPSDASSGADGATGGGGGGGGAGGGEDCYYLFGSYYGTGGAGGAGGGGGGAGTGGQAGSSGGASVALLVLNSTLRLETTLLQTDGGGRGGAGGNGGAAGNGGNGGAGGGCGSSTCGSGGRGGNGGRGGSGGCGGGGAGGPSVGILGVDGASVQLIDTSFAVGGPGSGGTSPCGNNGEDGLNAETSRLTLL